jgi:hypothetical protein
VNKKKQKNFIPLRLKHPDSLARDSGCCLRESLFASFSTEKEESF